MNKSLLFLSLLFGLSTAQLLPNAAMPAAEFAKALAASAAVDAKQAAAKKQAEADAKQGGGLDDEEIHIDTATAASSAPTLSQTQYVIEGPQGQRVEVSRALIDASGLFKRVSEIGLVSQEKRGIADKANKDISGAVQAEGLFAQNSSVIGQHIADYGAEPAQVVIPIQDPQVFKALMQCHEIYTRLIKAHA
jgi:hypothetical protein